MGSLVNVLGYELAWTKKRCVLRAPGGHEIALRVSSGCPEVSEATALQLIAEIEQEKISQLSRSAEETQQAMARARAVQLDPCWERSMREYVANGKFEDGFSALASATAGFQPENAQATDEQGLGGEDVQREKISCGQAVQGG